ncbi:MAG: hypothetical protein ABI891_16315 [Acidobacteriota bacterium]
MGICFDGQRLGRSMIEILNEFLERKIEFYRDYVEQIATNDKPQTELLDELFKETVFEVWK